MKYQPPTGGAANDPYVGRNLGAGVQGSRVPPKAIEQPLRELDHLVAYASGDASTRASIDNDIALGVPADEDLQQVRKAVQKLSAESMSRIQAYSAAGSFNWTVPEGVTRIRARVWGGGGGGGYGAAGTAGNGGGAGGYAEGYFAVTPGQVLTVTVGLAGVGGTVSVGATAGGTSSLGALLSATGGGAGAGSASGAQNAAGGTGTGGQINIPGAIGQSFFSAGSGVFGGWGGMAPGGLSAPQLMMTGTAPGQAATHNGNGGSGGTNGNNGGAGAPGRVIIEY